MFIAAGYSTSYFLLLTDLREIKVRLDLRVILEIWVLLDPLARLVLVDQRGRRERRASKVPRGREALMVLLVLRLVNHPGKPGAEGTLT